jgi:23S rRNA G2445 N2-methylase RlmL
MKMLKCLLDTSGETLSKHGYRKIPGKAPMLESLPLPLPRQVFER